MGGLFLAIRRVLEGGFCNCWKATIISFWCWGASCIRLIFIGIF